ncbi:MAG: hypothetical protein AAGC88_02875 [Bacteroidota bacterium]
MKHWLLVCFSFVLLSGTYGQKLIFKAEQYPRLTPLQSTLTTLSFFPSALLMVTNHEIGHTVVARLSGDKSASFKLYGSLPSGGTCFGCSFYDHTALSRFENALVPVGGFLFSQGLAFGSNTLLQNVSMLKGLQRFTALTYLLAKFDMSFQSLQGILRNNEFEAMAQTGVPSGTDVNAFAYFAANGNKVAYNWIRIGMVILSALDIYLFRKTISRNWKVLMNKGYYARR